MSRSELAVPLLSPGGHGKGQMWRRSALREQRCRKIRRGFLWFSECLWLGKLMIDITGFVLALNFDYYYNFTRQLFYYLILQFCVLSRHVGVNL